MLGIGQLSLPIWFPHVKLEKTAGSASDTKLKPDALSCVFWAELLANLQKCWDKAKEDKLAEDEKQRRQANTGEERKKICMRLDDIETSQVSHNYISLDDIETILCTYARHAAHDASHWTQSALCAQRYHN